MHTYTTHYTLHTTHYTPQVLLPVVHEFMTSQLVDGSWPVDAPLKQYLTFTDPDLEDAEWYVDAFPDSLTLCHAAALYTVPRQAARRRRRTSPRPACLPMTIGWPGGIK